MHSQNYGIKPEIESYTHDFREEAKNLSKFLTLIIEDLSKDVQYQDKDSLKGNWSDVKISYSRLIAKSVLLYTTLNKNGFKLAEYE